MIPSRPTLVLGVGNPTRGDDAAGWLLADRIQALGFAGVEVCQAQQLTPEWVLTWWAYDRVLVLDAACDGPEVAWKIVDESPKPSAGSSTSHGLSPATMVALGRTLYGDGPEVHVCALRADGFELGAGISPAMERRLDEALGRVQAWL